MWVIWEWGCHHNTTPSLPSPPPHSSPLHVAHLLGETQKATHRVRAGGKDEDKGCGLWGVLVQSGELDWGAFHKLTAKVFRDKVYGCKHNLYVCVLFVCVVCQWVNVLVYVCTYLKVHGTVGYVLCIYLDPSMNTCSASLLHFSLNRGPPHRLWKHI